MDAYQQLPTFNMVDFIFASTLFIDNAGMHEVFLCCNEMNRGEWIKAMIEQHKVKK
jgi:hypothetical protein